MLHVVTETPPKKNVHSVVLMAIRHCYALGFRGIRSDCAKAPHISMSGKERANGNGFTCWQILPDRCKLQGYSYLILQPLQVSIRVDL